MFLPVGESTVIDRVLSELESDERISAVYVSTNERFAGAFREYLDDRAFEKPKLTVEGTTRKVEKPGVVGALADLVDREGIEENIVVAGDNLISFDISSFVDTFRENGTPTLAAYDVGSREAATAYGVIDVDDGEVTAFQEKPDDPPSTLVSIACYGFPASALDSLEAYLAGGNNPDEPGWFVQWLVERRSVSAFTFDGAWFDVGTADSYLDAVAWHLDGDAVVHPSATVENSELGENVHVMADATVRNASLENTVIFPDAMVRDATFRRSVVDTEAIVEGGIFEDSLVGSHT